MRLLFRGFAVSNTAVTHAETSRHPTPMTASGRVLVLHRDAETRRRLHEHLSPHGYRVEARGSIREAAEVGVAPDIILLDLALETSGDPVAKLRELLPQRPFVALVDALTHESMSIAIERGAHGAVASGADELRLLAAVHAAREHARLLAKIMELDGPDGDEHLLGVSPAIRTARRIIAQAAPTDTSVLVTGEEGLPKSAVAGAIHRRSGRARGPFVSLDLAHIPDDLVHRTLFGRRGDSDGAIAQADGGTIFLDRIARLDGARQAELLYFLQLGAFTPENDKEERRADVRVIVGADRDPLASVRAGRLRKDLYQRLSLVALHLPPLRDRRDDIVPLARAEMLAASARLRKRFETLAPQASALLEAHPWPGNQDQLAATVRAAVEANEGPILEATMLGQTFIQEATAASRGEAPAAPTFAAPRGRSLGAHAPTGARAGVGANGEPASGAPAATEDDILTIAELEQRAILRAVELCGGSAAQAARRLGISEATIYRKLKAYRIS